MQYNYYYDIHCEDFVKAESIKCPSRGGYESVVISGSSKGHRYNLNDRYFREEAIKVNIHNL